MERSEDDGRRMCEAAGGLTGCVRVSLGVDQEPKKLREE